MRCKDGCDLWLDPGGAGWSARAVPGWRGRLPTDPGSTEGGGWSSPGGEGPEVTRPENVQQWVALSCETISPV